MQQPTEIIKVPKHLTSRLLYSNPVCLLTTKTTEASNVMTITWLTCLNNHVIPLSNPITNS